MSSAISQIASDLRVEIIQKYEYTGRDLVESYEPEWDPNSEIADKHIYGLIVELENATIGDIIDDLKISRPIKWTTMTRSTGRGMDGNTTINVIYESSEDLDWERLLTYRWFTRTEPLGENFIHYIGDRIRLSPHANSFVNAVSVGVDCRNL